MKRFTILMLAVVAVFALIFWAGPAATPTTENPALLDIPIGADTALDFSRWARNTEPRLPAADRRDLQNAFLKLRQDAFVALPGSTHDDASRAAWFLQRINHRNPRELMIAYHLDRLEQERSFSAWKDSRSAAPADAVAQRETLSGSPEVDRLRELNAQFDSLSLLLPTPPSPLEPTSDGVATTPVTNPAMLGL